jgi:hypothetical protein
MEIHVYVNSMIDIALAQYKRDRQMAPEFQAPDGNPILKKEAVVRSAVRNKTFDKLMRRLRHGAHRRHENHTKQVQFLLDRNRYQQNQTWLAEYDRLTSDINGTRTVTQRILRPPVFPGRTRHGTRYDERQVTVPRVDAEDRPRVDARLQELKTMLIK